MAFSGTAVLCGNGGMVFTRTFSSPLTFWLTAACCVLVVLSVLFNYRDDRTRYALLLVLAGAACMMTSVTTTGGLTLYYIGVVVVFMGVWLNASLLYFISLARRRLKLTSSR